MAFHDFIEKKPKSSKVYQFVLVVVDKFSNCLWTVPLKKADKRQKLHLNTFSKLYKKLKSMEADDGRESLEKILTAFRNLNNIKKLGHF